MNHSITLLFCCYITATPNEATCFDFAPTFTYPIFGEQEIIYGYRDLVIKLQFASGSLRNYLGIEYEGEPLTGDKVIDIEQTLYEFIPPGKSMSAHTLFVCCVMRSRRAFSLTITFS